MKKDVLNAVMAVATSLLILGCSERKPDNSDEQISSNNHSESSVSSEIDPNDEYYQKTIDDFRYYIDRIEAYVEQIWCWKKEDGHWYAGFPKKGSSQPSTGAIKKVLEREACPLYIMKEIIPYHSDRYEYLKVWEVDYYEGSELDIQFIFGYDICVSRNKPLYDELGLTNSYEHFFGNDEYHDITPEIDDDSIILRQSKYFSYKSNIYCWKNEDDEWRCGVAYENEKGLLYYCPYWLQNDASATLLSMKRLIDTYYKYYSVPKNNKIIEIPIIDSTESHVAAFEGYPDDIISSNQFLYDALGLEM